MTKKILELDQLNRKQRRKLLKLIRVKKKEGKK